MSKRSARIQKVLDLRQQELDDRLKGLAQARRDAEEALSTARGEEQRLLEARQRREIMLQAAVAPGDWQLTEDWLHHCTYQYAVAMRDFARAKQLLQQAEGAVNATRGEIKQLELVRERIASEERRAAERAEQKQSDEHAARVHRTPVR